VEKLKNIGSPQACACACKDHPECSVYTWSGRGNWCFLKNSDKGRRGSHNQAHSGNNHCCIDTGELCREEARIDYNGNDVEKLKNIGSPQACACACKDHPECSVYTWSGRGNLCFLKNSDKGRRGSHDQAHSGNKHCCIDTGVNYRKDGVITLKKGSLLTILPYIGKQFSVSFDLLITKMGSYAWQNVLHLTVGPNGDAVYGSRVPLVAVTPAWSLHVTSAISGNWNGGGDAKGLEQGRWIKVDILQKERADRKGRRKWEFEVLIDGRSKMKMENKKPEKFENIKVYASDPWHPGVAGKIRHLSIIS